MAEKVGEIFYDVTLDTNKLLVEVRVVNQQLGKLEKAGDRVESKFTAVAAAVSAALSAIAVESVVSKLVQVQRQFDVLFSSLKTVTGGVNQASAAWDRLTKFASETPYSLEQSVQGFVKLKALGLDPSERSMRSFGNTASAMGKDLMQMIEAVADASTGEFERLKEFGIKAKTEGDNVNLTFQGVTTTVKNSASAITEYLINIGETNFAGAMSERMKTLDGDIANLEDSIQALYLSITQSGFGDLLRTGAQGATKAIQELTTSIKDGQLTEFFDSFKSILPALEVGLLSVSAAITSRLIIALVGLGARAAMATVSFGLMTTAAGVFGAALTAMGGPIGVAITALGLLALNWDKIGNKAKSAADISEDAAARIAAAQKKSLKSAEKDLGEQDQEAAAEIKRLTDVRRRLTTSLPTKATSSDLASVDERLTALQKVRADIRAAQNGLGGGGGRGSVNPDIVQAPADEQVDLKKQAQDAKYLAQLRVRATQDALRQINLEEQAALADNEERQVKGDISEKAAQEGRTLIAAQFTAKRRVLAEKDLEDAAAARIAMITDEEQRIQAIKEESLRKAGALERMQLITAQEAARDRAVAAFEAEKAMAALRERDARANAQVRIQDAISTERQIALTQDEAVRQAEEAYRRGQITFAEAEAAKTEALRTAIEQQRQLEESRTQAKLGTLQSRTSSGGLQDGEALARGEAEAELQRVNEAQALDLENYQLYADQKVAIEAEMNRRIIDLRAAANENALASTADTFGSLALIMRSAAGEQSALYKTMFAASKAFAIAESIVKIQQGIANAAALPFPVNLGAMATVAASTASIISTIQGAKYGGGRQYGGPVSAGSMYRVNETGRPEMFTAGNGSQYMLPTANGKVTAADEVGGGKTVVQVQVINNHPGASVQTSTDNTGQIVSIAISEIANQISENSGAVWSAMKRSTNIQGRL